MHLGYGFDADRYQVLYERGLVPDRVPYGFHHAEGLGAAVTYSVDYAESTPIQLFRRGLQKLLGFDLVPRLSEPPRNQGCEHRLDHGRTAVPRSPLVGPQYFLRCVIRK